MTSKKRILCPVDLSDNSLAAIKLATTMAKDESAKLILFYCAPQFFPEDAAFGSEYVRDILDSDKNAFLNLLPTDPSVEYEHIYSHGNPGPKIVKESKDCDLVVMSTHGHSALIRMMMGSVAQYVLRSAKCPVILIRLPKVKKSKKDNADNDARFVTDVMHQVMAIHENDNIQEVLRELDRAQETAAPVVDLAGTCIGILTKTDIAHYRSLQERFQQKDESVVAEMFVTDKFGQRRSDNHDFDQVKRHMSSPVITIHNTATTEDAMKVFKADQKIHHLVVVDEDGRPLGILEPAFCQAAEVQSNESSQSVAP